MRKLFTLVLGMLLFFSLQLNAAYLRNIQKTITQPDGTVINCFASGDEFHNWLHDKDNYTIIQSQEDGYYYYAVKKGSKIVASEYKAGTTLLKSTNIQPGVNISAEQWRQKRNSKLIKTPLKSEYLKANSPDVNINQICIYVRFKDDAEYTKDTSIYYNWLNDEDPTAKSMINFYKEVSYGKVEVRSHFYPHSETTTVISYKDTQNRGYFQPYNKTTNPVGYDPDEESWTSENGATKREWDLLERVINDLNANYSIPNNIDLDWDNDGYIDNIEFFIAGDAGEWDDLLWPHNWAIQDRVLTIGGIKIFNYNFQIEEITDQRGVGVLSHEMGHALGYPDLYQYSEESTYDPVGPWDIMATTASVPQSFGAYTKFKYGKWIASIPEITIAGTYELNSIDSTTNNCYKIASPYSTTEYFVLEYRKKAGRFEASIPGSGLLIYRINTEAGNGNADGVINETPDEVYIYRPSGTTTENGYPYQAHYSSDVNRTAIDNTTNPTPFLFSGSIGGLYISEISTAGETISFRVDFNPNALYADFNASEKNIFAWETVDFTNLSIGNPETWEWIFEGGNPATYSGENPPTIQYSTPGTYDVVLTVTKGAETITETRTDYITVTKVPGTDPPRNLSATVTEANPTDVVLKWTVPENSIQSLTLEWDDGQNDGSGITFGNTAPWQYTILSHWEPSDLLPYDNWYLTEISFLAFTPEQASGYSYALRVYTGSALETQIVNQNFNENTITYGGWTTVQLTTPIQINASIDLWFGIYHDSGVNNAGFLFGTDNGPAVAGKGDIIYDSDGLFNLSDVPINKNWNLAATIVNSLDKSAQKSNRIQKAQTNYYKSMSGYNIYRNDVKINTTVVGSTTYTDNSVADGDYDYYVTAVYTAGESLASNVISISLPDNVSIPQVEIKELSIYPNPVKEKLIVQLEELSNDPLSLQIYNQLGKLVYSKEFTPSSNRTEIPINNLANGTYTLLIYSTEKAFQGKFIVLK